MKKRALFTIPLSLILVALIITSFFLLNIKPNPSGVSKAQKLAEYTKPAVVRIVNYAIVEWQFNDSHPDVEAFLQATNYQSVYGGSGSGAIISSDGYIVTNAHVVDISETEDADIANTAFEQFVTDFANYYGYDINASYDYLVAYMQYTKVTKELKVILPGGDTLDGEIKSFGAPINEGKDVAVVKIEGKNLPTLKLGNSDDIQNQDNIWVIGYPAAADSDLLSPDSSLVSSMNAGQISATSKKTEQGSPVIQLNAASTHGNSGGPVINEKGEIVGLLTFRGDTVNGQEVQGFNFAVPVNTVKEFVNQAGAKNKTSETDELYREGLTLYWAGYYKNALEKFEAVERIFPNHSEINRYISNAEKKVDESKTLWTDYQTLFYVGDGIAALVILLLMLFTFVMKPKQPQLAVAAASPAPAPPAAAPTPPPAPAPEAKPENTIPDLNNDGKIDIQDILLALQKQQEQQNKDKKDE
ncbi:MULTISPECIES: S1C family serine protease [unclassified Bacillus (in: firmicutes)]|uniref:S1C family serine protease n=1 Tax=unclassified Bacillus (in: firmicutes) TaxID=185979 RepID=UPI0008EA22B7|nr:MULTISPECIES: S1C family serine protease [unclassified Bacillus (in: firmicutes)]SFB20707.1 serine protease, S1-C subfamily, contains C-terminal PDZ domain [Bacillus sp. UNCCL13]SFQ90895.1 serine protease, S1-C subfamily, contains C-terminal PDZ domain [Bacillus sp. cl95]